ncbi:Gfo/Idh/MocA family protein [candidate division KSB1 bacterium]
MAEKGSSISRREFVGAMALTGAMLASCGKSGSGSSARAPYQFPPLLDQAPDGAELKAGLIGCGGRGTGASQNFLDAGPNLKIVAMADIFKDRVDRCRGTLKEQRGVTVPDNRCFVGLDAYTKLLELDLDLVIIATPPYYRPAQFKAAIKAGNHVFMEKPVTVDPVGARSIIETAGVAKTKGLNVVTGTQRRHQKCYVETFRRVMDGAIGDITAARAYWNGGQLWYRPRQKGWSNLDWMIRDWVNWRWLSGDHIVEQHVHNIDVINWFVGDHPVKAVGAGSRQRRVTGDQFDNFAIDFEFANGVHEFSMCRQVDGCSSNISEYIVGTKGSSNCRDTIFNPDGSVAWKFEGEQKDPYIQEHIHLVTAIRTGDYVNEAERTAVSTLTAIMGRTSAYTGAEVTWQEMMDSDMKSEAPKDTRGRISPIAEVPVAGTGVREPRTD